MSMFIFLNILLPCVFGQVFTLPASSVDWGPMNCTQIGPRCSIDCKTVGFCTGVGKVPHPSGQYDCEEGSSCVDDGTIVFCKKDAVCLTDPKLKIACILPGEIPHPLDCTRYFVCTKEYDGFSTNDGIKCPTDYFWNITTKGCELGVCNRQPITCHPNHGPVDKNNHRFLYYCFNHQIYVYNKVGTTTEENPNDTALNDSTDPPTRDPTTESTTIWPWSTDGPSTPLPTTEWTEETIGWPQQTTEWPQQATELSQESSEWPQQTSEWPQQTSEWPQQTSEWPQQTSEWPQQTSEWPQQTSEWPQETSEWPQQTSEWPEETTEWPQQTSEWLTSQPPSTTINPIKTCDLSANIVPPTCPAAKSLLPVDGKPCCYWLCLTDLHAEARPCPPMFIFNPTGNGSCDYDPSGPCSLRT